MGLTPSPPTPNQLYYGLEETSCPVPSVALYEPLLHELTWCLSEPASVVCLLPPLRLQEKLKPCYVKKFYLL